MAAQQIQFFKKNKADVSAIGVTVSASQNSDLANLAQGRSLLSGWMTTGSVDADNTTFEIDFDDAQIVDSIILVNHNFKAYTIKYWNGSAWVDFSPAINVSGNAKDTVYHSFTQVVSCPKVLLTISGTMVANSDKMLSTFVVTEKLGQFAGWPIIGSPVVGRNRSTTKMLSGKSSVRENIGNLAFKLSVILWKNANDLTLVQTLYNQNNGFLTWLTGGEESQFFINTKPYRNKDISLMKCSDEYSPVLYQGMYQVGQAITMNLVEVVD